MLLYHIFVYIIYIYTNLIICILPCSILHVSDSPQRVVWSFFQRFFWVDFQGEETNQSLSSQSQGANQRMFVADIPKV